MTIEVGTGTASEKFVKTKYPVTEGLTAGTTKQTGKTMNLVAEKRALRPMSEEI